MASTPEFAEHVLEQLHLGSRARVHKMFGEYCLYCDDKPVALICDNELFLKKLPEVTAQFSELPDGLPFSKAKPHLRANELLDDPTRLRQAIVLLAGLTPLPKPKKINR